MGLSKTRGLLLFSGGLDSLLAAKVLMEQNVDLTGIHFLLPFFSPIIDPYSSQPARLAASIGLKLRIENPFNEYVEMLKDPLHGYGKNVNPCIDCKILFLKLAGKILKNENYDFIATGEVNGQRPMSQRNGTIRHIEKSSGLAGYILRPLSARFFPKTIAEEKGLIDSNRLLDIHGRGRVRQMELVKKYGITEYHSPGGGCLFTEPSYARKLNDLFAHDKKLTQTALYLLTIGRHFRISDKIKIILSRNEQESIIMENFISTCEFYTETDFPAPFVLCFDPPETVNFNLIAEIIIKYSKPGSNHTISFIKKNKEVVKISNSKPTDLNVIEKYRIG